MQRRKFIIDTGILAGFGLLAQQHAIAQLFNVKQDKIRMLRKNVGIYTERGGTIGFMLAPEGIVVIDSQFADTSANFIAEIKKTNTTPFKFLLNTHHHGDHTSGNISFKGLVQHVIAHQNSLLNQKRTTEAQNAVDKQYYPDLTFNQEEFKLKMDKEKIKGYYFGPGHTNGDAVYHMEDANIAHLGDLMFNRRHPFIDRSSGANIRSWIKVLDKIVKKGDKETIYIFGHSRVPGAETGTAEDVKLFGDYLSKLLAFTEAEIKAGKSKEDFIKNTTIPGTPEWSGDGIQRPLTAAYEELTEAKKA
jgi:glyoxylase-like metal-dependent hydrolase (beta-lactamase superfamily II)